MKNGYLRGLAALLSLLACLWSAPSVAGLYSSMYVFGDSLSDSGNDAALTFLPLSLDPPAGISLVPNSLIYTDGVNAGRFTNGLNYADRLAAELGLPLAPSVLGGTNYAFGGARTDSINPLLAALGGQSFNAQLADFYNDHPLVTDPHGLYVLWIGANDMVDAIGAFLLSGNQNDLLVPILNTMAGIGNAITGIAVRGGQHFLVPNLPDLSLTPGFRGLSAALGPDVATVAQVASLTFNLFLDALLDDPFFSALDIRTLDAFGAQTAITQNPAAFGYTDVSNACYNGDVDGQPLPGGPAVLTLCSDPGQRMYFDYQHPTAALHADLARLALQQVVPEPSAHFLIGVALLAAFGRRRRISAAASK